MTTLFEQLFHDLLQRYRFLRSELAAVSIQATEIVAYRDRIQKQIDRSIAVIESLLDDLELAEPDFARNIYHAYKRLSEYAQFADEGPVSALSRFQTRDLFLTRLVSATREMIGLLQLVAAHSVPALRQAIESALACGSSDSGPVRHLLSPANRAEHRSMPLAGMGPGFGRPMPTLDVYDQLRSNGEVRQ